MSSCVSTGGSSGISPLTSSSKVPSMSLDLNMDYYHIKLDADDQRLCAMVFSWGKYKYKCLSMGIKIAADVFQNVMSKITQDMEYVKTYLEYLLRLTNKTFEDYLINLEIDLARLSTAGMRVNASKSKFFAEQIEYLGYWITRQGIQPIHANSNLAIHLNKTQELIE